MERIKVSSKQVEQLLPAQAIIDMKQALMVVDALLDAQLAADLAEHERVVREILDGIEVCMNIKPSELSRVINDYRIKYLKEHSKKDVSN